MFQKIVKEPLVHLILIGVALFVVYDRLNPATSPQKQIHVSQSQIDAMFKNQDPNEPRPFSLTRKKELIENFINGELLYKEAYRLGLHEDSLIRDRLIQKTRFYLEGQFVPVEPDENALKQFYELNVERYKKGATISFQQRLLKKDQLFEVQTLLNAKLSESELLEKIIPFQQESFVSASFQQAKLNDLEQVFGPGFFEQLRDMPADRWSGLVKSVYGTHLIKVTDRSFSGVAAFEDVRRQVKNDWIENQRELWIEERLRELRSKYGVNAKDFLND